MDRKIITIKDFKDVARNNEYFLWHFLQKEQYKGGLSMYSYFDNRENTYDNREDEVNYIKTIVDQLEIPYYESYTEDSIDFIYGLGYPYNKLWNPPKPQVIVKSNFLFNATLVGFKKFSKVSSTLDSCYCFESVLDVIASLNPELLLSLSIEEKDLK
jgi:hypothetical protein